MAITLAAHFAHGLLEGTITTRQISANRWQAKTEYTTIIPRMILGRVENVVVERSVVACSEDASVAKLANALIKERLIG